MSRRHTQPKVSPVAESLRSLDGARIDGGCEHCHAYQVLTAPAYGFANVAMLNTFHDDDCPILKQVSGR